MPIIQEPESDTASELVVESTIYAGYRIFIDIKFNGEPLAGVVKGATSTKPRRWVPAKVTTMFAPVVVETAAVYLLALKKAIDEARQLDLLYPPGKECSANLGASAVDKSYQVLKALKQHDSERIDQETGCHAGKDGDCSWPACPQARDGEPMKTGRACPLWRDIQEG